MPSPLTVASQSIQDAMLIDFGVCGLTGLILNSLLLCVLVSKLKKRGAHTDVKICTFIAFADILASIGILFRSIFTKFPYNIIKVHPGWCKFDGLISVIMNCSGYTLGVMSVERYLLICFNIQLSIWFWLIVIFSIYLLMIILTILSIASDLQVLTSTQVSCIYSATGVGYYGFLFGTILFVASFISVLVSYFGIIVKKSKQCLNQINLNVPKNTVYKELTSTLVKSLINIAIYLLCFSGKLYGLFYTLVTGSKRPMVVEIFCQSIICWSVVVNPIILLYMNTEIRNSLTTMLKGVKLPFSSNR
ncbi:family A G protein-coupled receptor-like protein [Conidiobolus coronatus NRRL 28638]|uniref:Family A G protein-coupled receptor-like protein n=1 Tax=Conidiobolus coronatus (strain ATCC 28846 / CBS 209.66 / NRRL 28638) TaxID=796925 RepID=A0A137NQ42_CONC2|nr:family A G protein-coupled receptor-like protein [Conidiobolus coronatus NRRL 28638]|eukprot:KXN64857.1 family A G protein-coupled receptor-like protein [Conidiobolus coronatus NRRL 28638]